MPGKVKFGVWVGGCKGLDGAVETAFSEKAPGAKGIAMDDDLDEHYLCFG